MGQIHSIGDMVAQRPDPTADVHQAAVASIEAARLRRHVRGLPPLLRSVICWRYGLDCDALSCRQVAERLGVSKATAWNYEQRALEMLRGCYEIDAEAA